MNFCKYCNTSKQPNDFYSYRPKKCKLCCINSTTTTANRVVNKDLKKENNKKYYLKHKSKIIEHNKKYYHEKKAQHQTYVAFLEAHPQPVTVETVTETLNSLN